MTDPGAVPAAGAGVSARLQPLAVSLDALPLVGPLTGVGVFVEQLSSALSARDDLRLSAYAVGRRSRRAESHLPPEVPARTWPVPARLSHMAWQYSAHPAAETIAGRVDVVHGTNFVVPPARRAATVVTVHDLTAVRFPELCAPASLAYPALVRKAVRRGAYVHTHAASVAAEVVSFFDADPKRVRAIPPGISTLPAEPAQPVVDGPYVLSLGTIEPRKDHPLLVRAFARAFARAGASPMRLVVAGRDGWGTAAFDDAVAAAGIESRLVRLGYVSEPERASLLRHAAALAYPSIYEGFGLPPLEAMAAGVPVVGTDGGALSEVLVGAALIVASGDEEGFAAALEKVVDDPGTRDGLIERGRARAAQFTWAATAEQMAALYREAAAERGLPDRGSR